MNCPAPIGMVGSAMFALAGCAVPPQPAPVLSAAGESCRSMIDSLSEAIPAGQSLAELQARGIRLRSPLSFPPGSVERPVLSSGAVVQMTINPDGSILPGSPKTLKSVGEPQIAAAMEAGALSMRFDFDGVAKPTAPTPYTTTFAVCVRP